ncbi:MAG: DUF922 domain-containing protein [Bacteroidota bacterium]
MKRFFNVAIIILVSSLIIYSQPDVKSSIEYYEIYGSTLNELQREIQKKGPREGGRRFDAYTTWRVGWEFKTISSNNKCTLKNVIVITEIKIVMPKWINYSSAKKEVQQIWDKYYKALLDHENGHKEIGLKAAAEIEKEIKKIKPKSSCAELERDINRNGDYVIAKYDSLEKEYDRKTNHGINAGAALK